jgi:tRNA U34 5-methylaminomethyl-2-thiouridine-forming methyltransferase MnmC
LKVPRAQFYFDEIHKAGATRQITDNFALMVSDNKFEDLELEKSFFDLVYFDAFAPDVQPELWSLKVFERIADAMKPKAILVTYSCKGVVKRALKTAGFSIEKLPGPPGKREFLRATRNS